MSATPHGRVVVVAAGILGLVLTGGLIGSPGVQADDEHSNSEESRIEQGLRIAPVPLTYNKRDRKLVGLGSYIVNGLGECNGCHSAGPPTQFTAGHNPFFGQTKMVNTATYLGGGRNFGKTQAGPAAPDIISRNLTPDQSGLPEGGATFAEFYETIRHGIDADGLHPNCSATRTTDCFNPPVNGSLLQVMPWPAYQDWTDQDLLAVYEYLKAIPCIPGPGHVC